MSDTTPAQPAQATSWITGDGKINIEAAPADFKPVLQAKQFDDVGKVLKSYIEMEKFAGGFKSKLNIPDQLDDAAISTIYTKLGRPESPDKYEFKKGENIKVELNEDLLNNFKKFAHSKNITAAQFNDLVNFQMEAMQSAIEAGERQAAEAKQRAAEALKAEWKEKYEDNFKQAKATAEKLEILADLEALGLADNPTTIKMLAKLNSKLSEDTLKPKTKVETPDSKTELADLMKSDAFINRLHPDHQKAHKRFLELHGVTG